MVQVGDSIAMRRTRSTSALNACGIQPYQVMLTGGRRAATEKVVEQGAKDYGRTSENEDTVAFHIRSSGQQGGDRLRENNHHDDYGSRSPQQDRADKTRTAATLFGAPCLIKTITDEQY